MLGMLSNLVDLGDLDRAYAWRAVDIKRCVVMDNRRDAEAKKEMLKTVSSISAIMAGFCMILLVDANMPVDLTELHIVAFTVCSTITTCMNLYGMIASSLLLMGVNRFDISKEIDAGTSFAEFWELNCAADWGVSLRIFSYGIPMFLLSMVLLGSIKFKSYTPAAAISICVLATFSLLFWLQGHLRWMNLLLLRGPGHTNEQVNIGERGFRDPPSDAGSLPSEHASPERAPSRL